MIITLILSKIIFLNKPSSLDFVTTSKLNTIPVKQSHIIESFKKSKVQNFIRYNKLIIIDEYINSENTNNCIFQLKNIFGRFKTDFLISLLNANRIEIIHIQKAVAISLLLKISKIIFKNFPQRFIFAKKNKSGQLHITILAYTKFWRNRNSGEQSELYMLCYTQFRISSHQMNSISR